MIAASAIWSIANSRVGPDTLLRAAFNNLAGALDSGAATDVQKPAGSFLGWCANLRTLTCPALQRRQFRGHHGPLAFVQVMAVWIEESFLFRSFLIEVSNGFDTPTRASSRDLQTSKQVIYVDQAVACESDSDRARPDRHEYDRFISGARGHL